MADLILFQRDHCHLCELAWEVLAQARVADFESVWIEGDAGLENLYGLRVPVLQCTRNGMELDWPFTSEQVQELIVSVRQS
ncbi:MAG: glutaredoxin family protein [Arenimonas sp.]